MSNWVFETTDYEGTYVALSQSTWHTKAGNDEVGSHPEIRDYLVAIQKTIQSPDVVFQSVRDSRARMFYLFYAGKGVLAQKHLVVVVKYVQEPTGTRGYVSTIYFSRSIYTKGERTPMASPNTVHPIVQVHYNQEEDTLVFAFKSHPRPAIAEEVDDDVWVRYDPHTQEVVTMEILHFSSRIHDAFGPSLTYTERTDPQRLTDLAGLLGKASCKL